MRLVYCIPSLENSGGTERVLIQRVNALVAHGGFEIYIVTTEQSGGASFFELSTDVHVIPLNIGFKEIENFPLWKKMLMFWYKERCYRKKLEHLLCVIKPHVTTSFLSREIDFLSHLKDGSYKIGENHFNKNFRYDFVRFRSCGLLKKWIAYLRYLQLIRCVRKIDLLVTLTQEDANLWTEIDSKKVIPNFLNELPDKYSACEQKEVIAMGRYAPEKGFDLLLQAWQDIHIKYPDWHLSIYGDGEERGNLEKYIKKHHLTNVVLHYPIRDIYAAFQNASIAVVPSRFEGFGMVIVEAMACGVPVVAFDCKSGPSEIISSGEDGYLVEAENVVSLKERIEELIISEDTRKLMGKKARRNVKRFSKELILEDWLVLYENLYNAQNR